jgi:hypothetical protein
LPNIGAGVATGAGALWPAGVATRASPGDDVADAADIVGPVGSLFGPVLPGNGGAPARGMLVGVGSGLGRDARPFDGAGNAGTGVTGRPFFASARLG